MNATDVFELWKPARLADTHRKPMGKAGLLQADLIWRKWALFCADNTIEWHTAQPQHVIAFCQNIAPRSANHPLRDAPPREGDAAAPSLIGSTGKLQASPVTMRRYWRIVNDIYAWAVLTRPIQTNPAAADGVMPKANERVPSLALNTNMWLKLHDGITSGFTYKERRNRLVLLLMMRCGLSVNEMVNLRVEHVQPHDGTPLQVSERVALAGLPLLQPESQLWKSLEPTRPM